MAKLQLQEAVSEITSYLLVLKFVVVNFLGTPSPQNILNFSKRNLFILC